MPAQCTVCLTDNPEGISYCIACGSTLNLQGSSSAYQVSPDSLPTSSGYHLPVRTLLKQGQYQIEKLLGEGGFGITYQGTYIPNSAQIAIKELWPEKAARQNNIILWPNSITPVQKQQQKNKFKLEASNQHQCNHPNIAQIYDWFDENDTVYIIMEFIPGNSLHKVLKDEGRLSENRAISYFLQVAHALQHVHQQNFLHRDIKPDNIIITPDDKAILIDFGAAKEFIAGQTRTMSVTLSPCYAPLEQYSYRSKRYPATDFYAFCASLYEVLTGELPADSPQRANNNSPDPLIPPRQICPQLSPLIEKVILTGMKMDIGERFQSADELIDSLNGKFTSPLQRQAKNLAKQGKLADAVSAYDKCLVNEPDNEAATLEKSLILLHLNNPQAEITVQQAIRLNPNNGIAYGILGLHHCNQGDWTEAVKHLQKATSLSPTILWIQVNLSWAFGKSNNWTSAEASISQALSLDPNSSFVLGVKSWIAYHDQQWKNAISAASQAIFKAKANPTYDNQKLNKWLYPYLISALERQQSRDIERRIEEFNTQYPDNALAWGIKGWYATLDDAWSNALTCFQEACKHNPVPGWVLIDYAIVQEHLNNIPGAIQTYEAFRQTLPPHPLIEFRLGTLLAQEGQWASAKSHLQTAVQLKSDYAEAYHNLGWVMLNIKTPDGQVTHSRELMFAYRKAIELYKHQNQTYQAQTIQQAFQKAGVVI